MLNYSLTLSDFIREDLNRYLNLLKKHSIFFSTFSSLPTVSPKLKSKVKLIPFSFVEGATEVQKIFQSDPILAADMWAVMTLALRSNDLRKI